MTRFDAVRRAAVMQELLAPLLRRDVDLLPFDQVRETLNLRHVVDRGLQEIPLDRIAGSLGRERDFTRAFLPREDSLRGRWMEVDALAHGPLGFPPIDVYQVGDAYFVVDGHHRVSVARSLGSPTIEARVREFLTPVPLSADESLEDVILKSGLADFLEATSLVPDNDREFRTTVPDGYARMLEHICVHRYFRGIDESRPVPWDEAVASWRDRLYRPVVERVRASGILEDFPERTEADLYLFVMDHLAALRERYGHVPPRRAADHFAALHRSMSQTRWGKLKEWWRERFARRADGGPSTPTESPTPSEASTPSDPPAPSP